MKILVIAIALSFAAGAASASLFARRPVAATAPATIFAESPSWKIAPSSVMDAGRCAEIVGGEQRCH